MKIMNEVATGKMPQENGAGRNLHLGLSSLNNLEEKSLIFKLYLFFVILLSEHKLIKSLSDDMEKPENTKRLERE